MHARVLKRSRMMNVDSQLSREIRDEESMFYLEHVFIAFIRGILIRVYSAGSNTMKQRSRMLRTSQPISYE